MRKLVVSGCVMLSTAGLFACSSPQELEEAVDYGRASDALLPAFLPDTAQGFEAVPSVVLDDGVSPFRIYYDVNRAVSAVRLTNPFIHPAGTDLNLYDDGTHGDEVAGDDVYTSSLLTLTRGWADRRYFRDDPRAPEGVVFLDLTTEVIEADGTASTFLVMPQIGILSPNVPLREVRSMGPSLQATDHFFNLRSDDIDVQMRLRNWGGDLSAATRGFYQRFADDYDFFMLWSLNKLEAINPLWIENFVAGRHWSVQTDFSGSALIPWDSSASYGSAGRLLGIALIDQGYRGMYGNNLGHELTHQWAAFTTSALGLQEDFAHYASRTSVASLVGGFEWLDNGDGTYRVNANIGRSGVHQMAPLDRYFAGFVGPEAVPPLLVARPGTPLQHDYVVAPGEIERRVTVDDIIASHGARVPGPATSRKNFRVAVGTVSRQRLLSAEEMTFYDVLAEGAFRPLAPGEPRPLLDSGFPTLSGYFGPGTELRGELLGAACTTCSSSLFGFEVQSDWQAPVFTNLDMTTLTQGSASLAVAAGGWTEITSRPFATSELAEPTSKLAVDLFIPAAQPNPFWYGDLHLFMQCPSAGLYQTWIGNQGFTGKPLGAFSTLQFTLPARVLTALGSSASDCSVKLALNVNRSSGTWRLDNLRFVP